MKRRRTHVPPILDETGDASPLTIFLTIITAVLLSVILSAVAVGMLVGLMGTVQ